MTLARTPMMILRMRGLLGLLRDREQRFFQRQAGAHQRRDLSRQQREVCGGDAATQRELLALASALGLRAPR